MTYEEKRDQLVKKFMTDLGTAIEGLVENTLRGMFGSAPAREVKGEGPPVKGPSMPRLIARLGSILETTGLEAKKIKPKKAVKAKVKTKVAKKPGPKAKGVPLPVVPNPPAADMSVEELAAHLRGGPSPT